MFSLGYEGWESITNHLLLLMFPSSSVRFTSLSSNEFSYQAAHRRRSGSTIGVLLTRGYFFIILSNLILSTYITMACASKRPSSFSCSYHLLPHPTTTPRQDHRATALRSLLQTVYLRTSKKKERVRMLFSLELPPAKATPRSSRSDFPRGRPPAGNGGMPRVSVAVGFRGSGVV